MAASLETMCMLRYKQPTVIFVCCDVKVCVLHCTGAMHWQVLNMMQVRNDDQARAMESSQVQEVDSAPPEGVEQDTGQASSSHPGYTRSSQDPGAKAGCNDSSSKDTTSAVTCIIQAAQSLSKERCKSCLAFAVILTALWMRRGQSWT